MLKRKHPFTITHDSEPLLKIRILQQELSHSVESGIALLNVSSKKRKREEETEFTMSCNGTKGSGDGPGKRMKSPEVSVSENKPVKVFKKEIQHSNHCQCHRLKLEPQPWTPNITVTLTLGEFLVMRYKVNKLGDGLSSIYYKKYTCTCAAELYTAM